MEAKRPGEYYPLIQESEGSYILNSRDLCMIQHIPELIQVGLDSLKIEGRMKSVHYVAAVTKTYREAIDAYLVNPQDYRPNQAWLLELEKSQPPAVRHRLLFRSPRPRTGRQGSPKRSLGRFLRRRGRRPSRRSLSGRAQPHPKW